VLFGTLSRLAGIWPLVNIHSHVYEYLWHVMHPGHYGRKASFLGTWSATLHWVRGRRRDLLVCRRSVGMMPMLTEEHGSLSTFRSLAKLHETALCSGHMATVFLICGRRLESVAVNVGRSGGR
jgi:hypothetical protein